MLSVRDAEAALVDAATAVGMKAQRADGQVVVRLDRERVVATVRPASVVSANDVRALPAAPSTTVIVAERVVGEAGALLRKREQSWLDLRGHLYLRAPGILVDADVPPTWQRPERRSPFSGPAGLDVATALLLRPTEPATVRGLARETGRVPSTVSEVLAALSRDGLVDAQRRPLVPDLFWAVAAEWRPRVTPLAICPRPGDGVVNESLELNLNGPEESAGWAVGDARAAAAYGAPIAVRDDHPPDFHVPDDSTLRRAVTLLGSPPSGAAPAATVRTAPATLVCRRRVDGTPWWSEPYPLVHPLFAALDLARDPARGRAVVEQWDPPEGFPRVW
jgi:hypothetical protein